MDRYSKIVLTLIAAGLWAIVVQHIIAPSVADAQGGIQHVVICNIDNTHCAAVAGDDTRRTDYNGA